MNGNRSSSNASRIDSSDGIIAVRTALISVSCKEGLLEFAQALHAFGVELYSTGGTRQVLRQAELPVRDIAEYTAFPEMMGGRVKTLHPKVFGGILARRHHPDDQEAMALHDIRPFDLVVVNLYPFVETIATGAGDDEAIEQIDIGGPSLIRAAAKNHAYTCIMTHPDQGTAIVDEIQSRGGTTWALRRRYAQIAFQHTADYDLAIAGYLSAEDEQGFPRRLCIPWTHHADLRYGENPHQSAAVYSAIPTPRHSLLAAVQRHGKELSYNNYLDLDAALRNVQSFHAPAVAVIKHTNPCGLATDSRLDVAATKALAGDPVSAFGSILGINRTVDQATAEILTGPDQFIEAIIAPGYAPEAWSILTTRPKWRSNVRLMELPGMDVLARRAFSIRSIDGGLLVQDTDDQPNDPSTWHCVTRTAVDDEQRQQLEFAWQAVRNVHSNAIVVARGHAICGVGAGQMSRVDAVEMAIRKAGERTRGAVLASDAFFPFPDSINLAADAGIMAVIQPGGSRNDDAVVAACDQRGVAMILTGRRHFWH